MVETNVVEYTVSQNIVTLPESRGEGLSKGRRTDNVKLMSNQNVDGPVKDSHNTEGILTLLQVSTFSSFPKNKTTNKKKPTNSCSLKVYYGVFEGPNTKGCHSINEIRETILDWATEKFFSYLFT